MIIFWLPYFFFPRDLYGMAKSFISRWYNGLPVGWYTVIWNMIYTSLPCPWWVLLLYICIMCFREGTKSFQWPTLDGVPTVFTWITLKLSIYWVHKAHSFFISCLKMFWKPKFRNDCIELFSFWIILELCKNPDTQFEMLSVPSAWKHLHLHLVLLVQIRFRPNVLFGQTCTTMYLTQLQLSVLQIYYKKQVKRNWMKYLEIIFQSYFCTASLFCAYS